MEYHHMLLDGEIRSGRINFGAATLSVEVLRWFEVHSASNVSVFRSDGTLVRRSVRIDRYKPNAWRFNCGIETFAGRKPGDVVVIRTRTDGNLELGFDQAAPNQGVPQPPVEPKHDVAPVATHPRPRAVGRREKLGELLNFRGLQHAPVNEQGVVFLFGMICKDLGYMVEIVRAEYPDCQGKRLINTDPEMWERVHIEFEYRSRNFELHLHDPEQCDVIVCWEHNWPECPLEVVELRNEIKYLEMEEK